jgi:hypothetical protein
MGLGKTVHDPDLDPINVKNLNFPKLKLFFKNISCYLDTLTYIHARVPYNFTQEFDTKNVITATYDLLLAKHE